MGDACFPYVKTRHRLWEETLWMMLYRVHREELFPPDWQFKKHPQIQPIMFISSKCQCDFSGISSEEKYGAELVMSLDKVWLFIIILHVASQMSQEWMSKWTKKQITEIILTSMNRRPKTVLVNSEYLFIIAKVSKDTVAWKLRASRSPCSLWYINHTTG